MDLKQFDIRIRPCYYFYEITKIPHGSYNEKAISDYVVQFAKDHHLPYKQDEVFNVIIHKKASPGYENAEPIILQAHMDMVNEKIKESTHDFEKDPLDLYEEDGWLHARNTTLGGDDGNGVAYMLAILEDETLAHPALTCIFTTMEEVGLIGATHLTKDDIDANRMISLDGGGEVRTAITSAGGINAFIRLPLEWETNTNPTYSLQVRGLSGGHSGGEIHKEKGNANVIGARLLKELQFNGIDVQLVSFTGGQKDNAIPRECDILFTSSSNTNDIEKSIHETTKAIQQELLFSDQEVYTIFDTVECAPKKLTNEKTMAVINYAFLVPNGLQHKSMAIEGLTQASTNLGVITMDEDSIVFDHLIRSAEDTMAKDIFNKLRTIAEIYHMEVESNDSIKGWAYSAESKMREIFKKVLQTHNRELQEEATHGGLECGVLKGLNPNLDIITFGPITEHVHTPDERTNITSFINSYGLLCEILENCK
ncbi:MAG: beta-Ala-His dipeptidase [Solobacterium sp.]|nr:beta-Ala-His dipeptidase [Solobacterium sp.]